MSDKRCIHCADNGVNRCDREHCDQVRVGEPYTTDQCRPCYRYFSEVQYNLAHGGDGKVTSAHGFPIEAKPIQPAPLRRCPHLRRRARDAEGNVKQRLCALG